MITSSLQICLLNEELEEMNEVQRKQGEKDGEVKKEIVSRKFWRK